MPSFFMWPREDPLGKTFLEESNRIQTVVGVVPDTVYTSPLERQVAPTFYFPLAQNYEPGVTLHVRAAGDPRALVPAIREAVRQVDSQLVVDRPQLLGDVLDRTSAGSACWRRSLACSAASRCCSRLSVSMA
jgi:hypothetical protein